MPAKRPAGVQPLNLRLIRFAFNTLGRLSPWLMGWWATRLWVTTRRFERSAAEKRLLDHSRLEKVAFADSHVVIYSWGDEGPAILLIHGWNGRGSHLAGFVRPLLRAGFRVIALDTPGHGDSPGKRSSIFQIVEALQAIERASGPFSAAIAHSFGCTCLIYAINQGLRVDQTVCIAPPDHFDGLVDKYAAAVQMPDRVKANMLRRLEKRHGSDFRERIDPVRLAPTLDIPCLVIHDRDDHDVPSTEGEAVANAWPGAELMLTDGLGHRRILRDRGAIRASVRFIARSPDAEPTGSSPTINR